jgi:large conductance mechanosensitive channel
MIRNFIQFIREQGIVGLAIGFILGGAVSRVVTALVGDIIQPLVGLALGQAKDLNSWMITIGDAQIKYGDFIAVLIDFLIIAAVVYFIFKGFRFDRIDVKKEEKK